MKRFIVLFVALFATLFFLTCCGGSGSKTSKQASVTFGPLDDFYSVKSYTIDSDAAEKGIEKLDNVKGTLTIVVKRNSAEMKYKPSDIEYATVCGEVSGSMYYVFKGDCEAVIRKIVKMEPESEDSFSIGFKGIDPFNKFNSDEENAANRQAAYDAITKKGCLDQISFEIDFVEQESDAVKALKALKDLVDDYDDD